MSAVVTQLQEFENRHWTDHHQKPVWRHRLVQGLIRGGSVLDVGGGDGLLLSML